MFLIPLIVKLIALNDLQQKLHKQRVPLAKQVYLNRPQKSPIPALEAQVTIKIPSAAFCLEWSWSMWQFLCNFPPESSSDEEATKKPAAKVAPVKAAVAKATAAAEDSSEEDSSSDEEETAQKPAAKSAPTKTAPAKKDSSSSGKMKTFWLWKPFDREAYYFGKIVYI